MIFLACLVVMTWLSCGRPPVEQAKTILRHLSTDELVAVARVYTAGQQAVSNGHQPDENPYPQGSREWAAWIVGYHQERYS